MSLEDHRVTVPDEWIDYNDHLTEGYYGVAFADAGDWVLLQAGFDDAYRRERRGTFYTAECQTWFRKEVAAGAEMAIRTTVLGADPERVHLLHEMVVEGEICALQESMLLHVDADTGRVAPMAPGIQTALASLVKEHADRKRPRLLGSGVRGMPAG